MNQISGKITSVQPYHRTRHYHIKHQGHRHNPGRGVCWYSLNEYKSGKYMRHAQRIPSFMNHKTGKYDYAMPTVRVSYVRKFYGNFRNKLRSGNSYIMKNSEIPFEFMHQPALPCFADMVPTKNDNITFQQSLKELL